ncbi:aspartate kinase [Calorimonas adulescens]|uniref:Aspartokinase n=1 Tax=Calorimonas adulescens TaxID=2606906 RepID=A0A5D8QAM2_9THEO|nr:aspartate kinase [Calorimonas adulescens]TZE80826.1 aspartate kinase [Calorimonas adulescens]
MKTIVLKFGGTILGDMTLRERAGQIVQKYYMDGYCPIVVVSAMGRLGDPYSTDTLLKLVTEIHPKINLRELDMLLSCGEVISSVIFHATLSNYGLSSIALTGAQAGIITDRNFGKANVLRINVDNILKSINNKMIPIISGFQGITEEGDITTLGRGTSDYTACLLGSKLGSEQIVIYKDVDGLMSADPKIVTSAKTIEHINYEDVFQMAEFGAKVIHPLAVETAMKAGIPLLIKNIMKEDVFTLIDNQEVNKIITAVTCMPDRVQYIINTSNENDKEIINEVFNKLADAGISIDLINIFPDKKIFTIEAKYAETATAILNQSTLNYVTVENLVKVSIIGNRMRGVPGIMAKIIKAFSEHNIEILQTSDSHNSISCLVKKDDYKNAMILLHNIFSV